MSNASDDDRGSDRTGDREEHDLHPEGLHPEEPAAGVEDVIAVFDREPPERPVTDAEAQPPFG